MTTLGMPSSSWSRQTLPSQCKIGRQKNGSDERNGQTLSRVTKEVKHQLLPNSSATTSSSNLNHCYPSSPILLEDDCYQEEKVEERNGKTERKKNDHATNFKSQSPPPISPQNIRGNEKNNSSKKIEAISMRNRESITTQRTARHSGKNQYQENGKKKKKQYCKVSTTLPSKHHHLKIQDHSSSDDEPLSIKQMKESPSEYKYGGYHPVLINQIYKSRYVIKKKLGWGQFSTVWLANDQHNNSLVAIKFVKSANLYSLVAKDEICFLLKILESGWSKDRCVVRLLDHFEHVGPNGTHRCLVFEHLGFNLLTLNRIYRDRGLPIILVKIIMKQMLIGLDYLHQQCKIIHTDLKPENVLLVCNPRFSSPPSDSHYHNTQSNESIHFTSEDIEYNHDPKLPSLYYYEREHYPSSISSNSQYSIHLPQTQDELLSSFGHGAYRCRIVDLGNACWVNHRFTDNVQTRQYRAPEIVLGYSNYGPPIDIWSASCIMFELLTGDTLFNPQNGSYFDKDEDHLAQIIELLGPMPSHFALHGKHSRILMDDHGKLKRINKLHFWPLGNVLIEKHGFSRSEADEISSFMLPMLNILPEARAKASEMIKHPWIRNIDISNFGSAFD